MEGAPPPPLISPHLAAIVEEIHPTRPLQALLWQASARVIDLSARLRRGGAELGSRAPSALSRGAARWLGAGAVHTADGAALPAGVLIKAVGFEPSALNSALLGRTHARGNGLVEAGLWLVAEGHLDSATFGSPFGSSYLSIVQYTAAQLLRHAPAS